MVSGLELFSYCFFRFFETSSLGCFSLSFSSSEQLSDEMSTGLCDSSISRDKYRFDVGISFVSRLLCD